VQFVTIIGMFEFAFGLTSGKLLFNIPMEGSLGLIFLPATVYLFVILSLVLFYGGFHPDERPVHFHRNYAVCSLGLAILRYRKVS
jgi:ABC-2 type transport system permease protein